MTPTQWHDSRREIRAGVGRLAPWLVASLLAAPVASVAGAVDPAGVTEVKVERVRPEREKLVTLRFLRANRDFIRARFDRLRETPVERRGGSTAIDPRFLTYQELLAEVRAAEDTVGRAEDERSRRHLLESIAELGSLESQLDLVERQLGAQRVRLATLEDDFTGRQQTALLAVVKGFPSDAPVSEIALTIDDGPTLRVPLSAEQQESLRHGGLLEIFHGAIEPRAQVVQVTLAGAAWPGGDSGYVTLDPLRDRLTFLRLDLSEVHPAEGAAGIRASTWLHEAPAHLVGG